MQSSWSGCKVELVTLAEGLVFEDDDVDLRIDDAGIELCYWDDQGAVIFTGAPSSDGHFQLVCRSRPRVATLHFTPGERVLEGSWSERDERGHWRIELPGSPDV